METELLYDLFTILSYPGFFGLEKSRYGISIPPFIEAGTDCFLIGSTLQKEWQVEWSEATTLEAAARLAAESIRALAPVPVSSEQASPADLFVLALPTFYRLRRGNRIVGGKLFSYETQDYYQIGFIRGVWIEWWQADTAVAVVQKAARSLRARETFLQQGGRIVDLLPDSCSKRERHDKTV